MAPATLLKKRLWHRCFPVNFAKFLRTTFLQNTSWRLLSENMVVIYAPSSQTMHKVSLILYSRGIVTSTLLMTAGPQKLLLI